MSGSAGKVVGLAEVAIVAAQRRGMSWSGFLTQGHLRSAAVLRSGRARTQEWDLAPDF